MRKTLRITVAGVVAVFMLALAGPAMAHHDHQLTNPSGCHTIRVGHQAHTAHDPGRKFHGAAHDGAATAFDPITKIGVLGKGNSPVTVTGGACPA